MCVPESSVRNGGSKCTKGLTRSVLFVALVSGTFRWEVGCILVCWRRERHGAGCEEKEVSMLVTLILAIVENGEVRSNRHV